VDRRRLAGPEGCDQEKGPLMQRIPPLTMYRVEVAWLLDAGEPLSDVAEEIGRIVDLTLEERAALRRFAFAHRGPRERQGDAADISGPSSSEGSR
jgi:hypothetical protein